jgi:hypothetical protein
MGNDWSLYLEQWENDEEINSHTSRNVLNSNTDRFRNSSNEF